MALINCPECNNQISDAAKACPQCGYAAPVKEPFITTEPRRKGIGCGTLILAFIVVIIWGVALGSPAHAEIYKWTDADGNIHFGDAPAEGVEAEATGIQPAPLTGSAQPSNSRYSSSPSYSTSTRNQPTNEDKSRARLEAREAELASLRRACENAKKAVAHEKYWRGQFLTPEYRHQADSLIKAAKRREDEACKLSNFR